MRIYIKSFTQAQKARNYLAQHDVRCMIERTQNRGQGCGFALNIMGSVSREKVCALLAEIGVSCGLS